MLGTLSGEACPLRILQRVGGSSFGFSRIANVWRRYVSNHANRVTRLSAHPYAKHRCTVSTLTSPIWELTTRTGTPPVQYQVQSTPAASVPSLRRSPGESNPSAPPPAIPLASRRAPWPARSIPSPPRTPPRIPPATPAISLASRYSQIPNIPRSRLPALCEFPNLPRPPQSAPSTPRRAFPPRNAPATARHSAQTNCGSRDANLA